MVLEWKCSVRNHIEYQHVLILLWVEYGLGVYVGTYGKYNSGSSLNPSLGGIWSWSNKIGFRQRALELS